MAEMDIMKDGEDKFKSSFKYYKSKKPFPDLSLILDAKYENSDLVKDEKSFTLVTESSLNSVGLKNPNLWETYKVLTNPGLFIVKNVFTEEGLIHWAEQCLCSFPQEPHKTNLESHNISLTDETWWNLVNSRNDKEKFDILKKLRWVTMGYHHDWDTKVYNETSRTDVPRCIVIACDILSKYFGYPQYVAEAVIVNYYHEGSTLAPHTDHSEPYMEAPLFSFSFGESAIFLVGGEEKSVKPTALYLHNGDVMVMTGESRKAYHAVPKIITSKENTFRQLHFTELKNNFKNSSVMKHLENRINYEENLKSYMVSSNIDYNNDSCKLKAEESYWKAIQLYMSKNRINLNIRQVMKPIFPSVVQK